MKSAIPLHKGDFIVAIVILLLAALTVLMIFLQDSEKKYCTISKDGAIIETVELSEKQSKTVSVSGEYENTVQIQDGRVCVSHSSCPNQFCVGSGWISHSGQSIVCLPNQVLIQIVSEQSEQEVDVIVG